MSHDEYYASAPVLLQYGPLAPPTSTTRDTVGKVLTVLGSVFGPPAAAVTAFIAAVEWSGCFIECNSATDTPDHVAGGLLWLLAVALLLSGPLFAVTLVRKAVWIGVASVVPVLALLLLAGTLAQ